MVPFSVGLSLSLRLVYLLSPCLLSWFKLHSAVFLFPVSNLIAQGTNSYPPLPQSSLHVPPETVLLSFLPPPRTAPIQLSVCPFCAEYLLLSTLVSISGWASPLFLSFCLLLNPYGRFQLLLYVTPT